MNEKLDQHDVEPEDQDVPIWEELVVLFADNPRLLTQTITALWSFFDQEHPVNELHWIEESIDAISAATLLTAEPSVRAIGLSTGFFGLYPFWEAGKLTDLPPELLQIFAHAKQQGHTLTVDR